MMTLRSSRRSLLEIHLATVLFGLAGLFGKWITLSPFLIVLGRVLFASLALGFFLMLSKLSLRVIVRRRAVLLFLLGGILAAHWVAFFQSIRVSSVAVGLLSYSCFPIFTVFLEPLLFKERISLRNLLCSCLCVVGVFGIVPHFDLGNAVYRGVLWGLLSGLAFAVLTVFNRRLSQAHSSLAIAFFEDLFAALFLGPFLFISVTPIGGRNMLLIVFLGVICTAGSHTLFIKGMRHIRAQTASVISALEPVYGIVLAFLLLGERPAPRTLIGGAIILVAVLLVSLREKD
jgi:drug/metabolite transporter (DMT)-like permease